MSIAAVLAVQEKINPGFKITLGDWLLGGGGINLASRLW